VHARTVRLVSRELSPLRQVADHLPLGCGPSSMLPQRTPLSLHIVMIDDQIGANHYNLPRLYNSKKFDEHIIITNKHRVRTILQSYKLKYGGIDKPSVINKSNPDLCLRLAGQTKKKSRRINKSSLTKA
jgi:hypothetical protein